MQTERARPGPLLRFAMAAIALIASAPAPGGEHAGPDSPMDTKTLPSGVAYRALLDGDGERPSLGDVVEAHYVGKLTDGTVFDSSRARGGPAVFALDSLIQCWQEGIVLMRVGGKASLECPAERAAGDRGSP